MKKFRKWILYTVYIFGAALFFLYYLFPSEKVSEYISFRLEQENPDFRVAIGKVKPSFPPGLKFTEVSLFHLDQRTIDFEEIKVFPVILSLLKDEKSFDFKGYSCKGSFQGIATMNFGAGGGKPPVSVASDFTGIHLEMIKATERLSDVKVSGVLDGEAEFERTPRSQKGKTTFSVSQCNISPTSPMLKSLGTLTFKNIDGEVILKNREMDIKKFTGKGDQMDGHITGLVNLKENVEKSSLNLTGKLKPHPSFLKGNGVAALFFRNKGSMSFNIKGALEKPMFVRR